MKKTVIVFVCGFVFALLMCFLFETKNQKKTVFADMFTRGVLLDNGDMLLICLDNGINVSSQTPWGFACVFKKDLRLLATADFPVEMLRDSMFQLDLSRSKEEVVMFSDNINSGVQYTMNSTNFCMKAGYRLSTTNVLGKIMRVRRVRHEED